MSSFQTHFRNAGITKDEIANIRAELACMETIKKHRIHNSLKLALGHREEMIASFEARSNAEIERGIINSLDEIDNIIG